MLAIIGTAGQILYLRHAEPGSPSERALSLLAGDAAETVPAGGRDSGALANSG
jgi:hypothetical protein